MEEKNGEQCQQCSTEQEKKSSQCNFKKGYYLQVSTSEEHRKSHAREKNGFPMSNIEEKEMVVDLSMEEKGKFGNLVFKIIEF